MDVIVQSWAAPLLSADEARAAPSPLRRWAAAGQGATTGLFVVSPQGQLLLHKPMPEFSTNLAFGGPDRQDLYFTASTSVYQLRTRVPGARPREK